MITAITTGVYTNNKIIDFAAIRRDGYEGVDMNLCDVKSPFYQPDEQAAVLLAKEELQRAQKVGLRIVQTHGPWPTDDTTPEKRAKNTEYFRRAIRLTAAMECPYTVVHPMMPFGWDGPEDADVALEMNIEHFRALCDDAAPYGVTVCAENMPFLKQRISTPEQIAKLVALVDRPNCGICLDTGHANVFRVDAGEAVRQCGRYLKALHVHDNAHRSDSHDIPFSGDIRWDHFTAALKEIGFNGAMSIETKVRRDYPSELRQQALRLLADIARALALQAE